MIPYSPDDLIEVANKEFAWCDRETLRASGEMGFASDWKKAVEAVKNKYVEPGPDDLPGSRSFTRSHRVSREE